MGSSAISAGVLAEAAFVGWAVRPALRMIRGAPPADEPALDAGRFVRFYVPLALTPLVTLLLQPLGSAAMNRLPLPLESLAVWPAVHGLVFLTRSVGFAYNEVVVALADAPGAHIVLRRFRNLLALSTTLLLLVVAATPLAGLWFERVNGLSPFMAALAGAATALAVPMPGLQALQSHSTGLLVAAHRTRGVTEAVVPSSRSRPCSSARRSPRASCRTRASWRRPSRSASRAASRPYGSPCGPAVTRPVA